MRLALILVLALFATYTSASFISDLLADQNAYRTPLNLAPFTWSNDLAQSAQTWANHLASIGKLIHSGSNNGENLAYVSGTYSGDTNLVDGSSGASTTSTAQPATSTAQPASTNSNDNSNSGDVIQGVVSNVPNQESQSSTPSSTTTATNTNDNNNNNGGNVIQGVVPNVPNQEPQTNTQSSESNNNGNSNSQNTQNVYTHSHTHHTGSSDKYSFSSNDGGNSDGGNRRRLDDSSDSQLSQLVGLWGAEKQYFVYGTFPDVSSTGDWSAVGHYTQLVWGETKQVGCGIANGGGLVFLVCQYSPAGNWEGEQVY